MLFADVASASRAVAATSARNGKVQLVAALLRAAGPDDAAVVVPWLSGDLRQRRTGIGWAMLRDISAPAAVPTLTVADVDTCFERASTLSGSGSAGARRRLVHELFADATAEEQAMLRGLVSGELRQGALEGVMLDAVAAAAAVPAAAVRRAAMLCGSVAVVAEAALRGGEPGLAGFRLQVGRPVLPMLASTADTVADAVAKLGVVSVDTKLDGIRVQVHRSGSDITVFTRSLDDVTARVPEVVAAAAAMPARTLVLDGEAIALRDDGTPRPFQETGARAATRSSKPPVPLSLFVFDALHVDGDDLLDRPLRERQEAMDSVAPPESRVARLTTDDATSAQSFLDDSLLRGHEGVVVKSVESAYDAGRRGAAWQKVKPVHTLDLVVLAAEWGHGRRRGWLSNLHLGARDAGSGEFVMLGKTFKGMTDEMLRWQTERLLSLEVRRNEWQVFVQPAVVVEIAFDGVQSSPRYPGGVALRFARVVRYREDKRPEEADDIATVRAFLR